MGNDLLLKTSNESDARHCPASDEQSASAQKRTNMSTLCHKAGTLDHQTSPPYLTTSAGTHSSCCTARMSMSEDYAQCGQLCSAAAGHALAASRRSAVRSSHWQ